MGRHRRLRACGGPGLPGVRQVATTSAAPARLAAPPGGGVGAQVDALCRALCLQTCRPAHRGALTACVGDGAVADVAADLAALGLGAAALGTVFPGHRHRPLGVTG